MSGKVKNSGKKGFGFNALKGVYENMFDAGIVDPAKVTRSAAECCFHCGDAPDHRSPGADKPEENKGGRFPPAWAA